MKSPGRARRSLPNLIIPACAISMWPQPATTPTTAAGHTRGGRFSTRMIWPRGPAIASMYCQASTPRAQRFRMAATTPPRSATSSIAARSWTAPSSPIPCAAFEIAAGENTTNYVIIDGFELAASSEIVYGQGIKCWNGGSLRFQSHHIWVTNCIIHGYGQSGIQMNDGDYYYAVHNTLYNNCAATCDARGSGISFCSLKPATDTRQPRTTRTT